MADGWSIGIGALASLASGWLGQQANSQGVLLSAEQQKKLMDHQAKLNYKYYQKDLINRWQLARQGLEKGDYNPMLALQGINGNSNWASQSSISDTGAGQAYNSGVANANTLQQIRQQGLMNDSNISLNNSQALLNEAKANTELYTQLEKSNHADLLQAESTLRSKQASYEDKRQAMEQMKYAKEIEELGSKIKLNQQNVLLLRSQSDLNNTITQSNSEDVLRKRIENNKLDQYYNNPKYAKLRQKQWEFGQMLNDLTGGSKLPNINYSPKTFNKY